MHAISIRVAEISGNRLELAPIQSVNDISVSTIPHRNAAVLKLRRKDSPEWAPMDIKK